MQTRLCKHREAPEDSRSQISNHLTEYISVQRRTRETEKISAEKTKKPVETGFFVLNIGVADGARTHDNRNHNPGLYQLSYSHH